MGFFDVAVLWLVVWLFKNAVMDVAHAVKGTPNPRWEAKKAKALAAGRQAPARPRYGTREWAADLLSDGLAAQTERRRRKAAERAAERGKPSDPPATAPPEHPAGWTPPGTEPPAAPATPPDAAPQVDPPNHANPKPEPVDNRPTAPVIPLFRDIPKPKENSMTVNGEVTGLDPAISYSRALARFAGEHGSSGNEGYVGFLADSKVSGVGLQSAHDMQAAFTAAMAAAERHASELEKQKSVQEAYTNVPDAGDKQFQTNGQ